ncbi:MAG TPA: esterase-like activity of phytase family protein [Vicinamibacterales bacterium]|nr:esterase-like activity of phytase family protein [Vicinamibacterales bacterium]
MTRVTMDAMKLLYGLPLLVLPLLAVSAYPRVVATQANEVSGLTLSGEFLIAPGARFAAIAPSRFGAISGLATLPGGCELLAISDDDVDSRFYRLRVSRTAQRLQVTPVQYIPLQRASGAPASLDPEGIALTRTGTVLISAEGAADVQPRLPPAILEYAQDGRFIRQLRVPPQFVPNEGGPQTKGARNNGGFESLTVTPDFDRLFTANEIPLVQDGPADAYAKAQRVRILEYANERDGYRPVREFVYELSPLDRPSSGAGFSVNGVSELLAVNGTELFALERGFIQAAGSRIGINRIRLFRIWLDGATDVSSFDSLAGRDDVKPVRKTLVQDFSRLSGLSLRLLNLENFEGLAWVGPANGEHRSLLAVSDDNFNPLQVTAFLLLELDPPQRAPVCP